MGKFLRLLVMFGPMIYKGVNKFLASRKKENQILPPNPENEDDFVEE